MPTPKPLLLQETKLQPYTIKKYITIKINQKTDVPSAFWYKREKKWDLPSKAKIEISENEIKFRFENEGKYKVGVTAENYLLGIPFLSKKSTSTNIDIEVKKPSPPPPDPRQPTNSPQQPQRLSPTKVMPDPEPEKTAPSYDLESDMKEAENGNPDAQCRIGEYYEFGPSHSILEAKKWYGKAARQGHSGASYRLKNIGKKPNPDPEPKNPDSEPSSISFSDCLAAANRGDASAQTELASRYEEGRDTVKNVEEAIKWYRKAAENGNADAQDRMGLYYEVKGGNSIPEAKKWYEKAARQGHSGAAYRLEMLEKRYGH